MRNVLVAVAGMVLGLGGGATWGAVQERDAVLSLRAEEGQSSGAASPMPSTSGSVDPAPGEGVAPSGEDPGADELADGAGVDTLVVDAAPSDSAAPSPADTLDVPAVGVEAAVEADTPVEPAPVTVSFDGEGARRLGKIFSAMKPADAAGVMGQMSDAEAAAVLMEMSDRHAAPILGNLPPDRAAVLGRVVLAGRAGAGG